MSDEDTAMVAIRAVLRPPGRKHAIPNAVDGPCFDFRINAALNYDEVRREIVGPFLSEDDFNNTLRCGALPDVVVHCGGHWVVFTYSDSNLRNVLVKGHRRLAGSIDWETAGWFPEY